MGVSGGDYFHPVKHCGKTQFKSGQGHSWMWVLGYIKEERDSTRKHACAHFFLPSIVPVARGFKFPAGVD